MAIRALILAIEHYGRLNNADLDSSLPGTHDSAKNFYHWLVKEKKVRAKDVLVCTDADIFPGPVRVATAAEIDRAVSDLVKEGKDNTEELYVFFSGHGFVYQEEAGRKADVLVAVDFEHPDYSGSALREVAELQQFLRVAMGPGEHFYFIDACRNFISAADMATPGRLGVRRQRSLIGDADRFTLFSTVEGAVADVESSFAHLLLQGLSGTSTAKTWSEGRLVVNFASLKRFLTSRMPDQRVDGEPGRGFGLIWEVLPVPRYTLTLKVQTAAAPTRLDVSVELSGRNTAVKLPKSVFYGTRVVQIASLPPDRYRVSLTSAGSELEAQGSNVVDLFEDQTITFATPAPVIYSPMVNPPSITIHYHEDLYLDAHSLDSGASVDLLGSGGRASRTVAPGDYRVTVASGDGRVLSTRDVKVRGSRDHSIDFLPNNQRPTKRRLRQYFGEPNSWDLELPRARETDQDNDLAVWLAVIGAGHIVEGPDCPEKLRRLKLNSFGDLKPGRSAIYVLATLKNVARSLRFGFSEESGITEWQSASSVEGVPGLREIYREVEAGGQLLSISRPGHVNLSFVSHTWPNRITLITVTDTETDGFRLHQYGLPVHHLKGELEDEVVQRIGGDTLQAARFLAQAQRRYSLEQAVAPSVDGSDRRYWESLLYAKWLEPITATIAAYELVRRGQREHLKEVVGNLRKYFGPMPDTEALARLAGLDDVRPIDGPPMMLDGLLGLEIEPTLPLPGSHLLYTLPWTSWRGAVT
ncbi:MAG: caspase family protein [Thermoanaerobaculia bacterium]|nr:caspase family protein [Thermoanaerobaculia bacterium]